jgi:hypothetical protein
MSIYAMGYSEQELERLIFQAARASIRFTALGTSMPVAGSSRWAWCSGS